MSTASLQQQFTANHAPRSSQSNITVVVENNKQKIQQSSVVSPVSIPIDECEVQDNFSENTPLLLNGRAMR